MAQQGSRSQRPPADVRDLMLWRQATRVAAAHRPDPAAPGRCAQPSCRGRAWPCPAHRWAGHAQQAARTRHTSTPPAPEPAAQIGGTGPAPVWVGWWYPRPAPPSPPGQLGWHEGSVLRLLRGHAPLTAADLVAGCRLSPQVVQRALLRLARAGLAGHHTHHR